MKSEKDALCRSSEFWGICCEGSKKYSQTVSKRFHITMAALDPTVVPTSPVVSLMVDRGGCEYLLCSLKPSSLLQVNLNLYFDKGEKVTFFLKGSGKIHLSGYHILDENLPIQNKTTEKTVPVQKISAVPVQKNKSNPTQNVKASKDIANVEKESSDEDDESSEDEESSEENKDLKKDSNKLTSYKRLWSSLTQSDEESEDSSEDDDDDDDEEEEVKEVPQKKAKNFQDKKKLKTDTSTPVLSKKTMQNTSPKSNKLDAKTSPLEKSPKSNDAMNSSIGRTPMPQKKTPKVDKANVSPKKVNFADSDESSDSDIEVESPSKILSPSKNEESSPNKDLKKKKKKKKKAKDALNNTAADNTGKKEGAVLASASYSQKLPGGLQFEDIRVGNGPPAKKGRLVHVYYTGQLANSKEFDSRKPGTKPFSFKLGSEQVIKGWDLGIEGMKVGGKRRLKIPPHLGYKNERMGPIPPMSTLFFTVELKAVS